jgi:hypothetical protein
MLPLALARRRRALALLDLHQGETALDILALAERRCTGRSHVTFQEANAIDYRFRRQRLTPQPPFKSTNTCLTSQRRCVRCGDLASLAWEAENLARAEKMFHAWRSIWRMRTYPAAWRHCFEKPDSNWRRSNAMRRAA